jgi:hypothetical protein
MGTLGAFLLRKERSESMSEADFLDRHGNCLNERKQIAAVTACVRVTLIAFDWSIPYLAFGTRASIIVRS